MPNFIIHFILNYVHNVILSKYHGENILIKNKNKRIELRFGLTAPGSMWNLLYEGMEQNINLRTTFKGKDEESIDALIKFGEILKKKKNYDINITENGIEINKELPINDFKSGEKWTDLMTKLKEEITKII